MTTQKWAMLCKLKVAPFDDDAWRWERKLDGDRIRVDIDSHNGIGLTARSGADKTAQFPDIVQAIALTANWAAAPMILDGEVVSAGGLSFQEFNQRRMNRTIDIDRLAIELPASLVTFDVLSAWGRDMEPKPLAERLKVLSQVKPGWCRLPESSEDGVALFERAVAERWEGVVGKDMRQPYMPGRRAWVKVKRWLEGEFWVVGFTAGTGKRSGRFGSLILATWDAETCDFKRVAECGTGMDEAELDRLDSVRRGLRMEPGHACLSPYPTPGRLPKVKVKYVEETNAGSLRFPVYLGQIQGGIK